jgi:hypothetical protein
MALSADSPIKKSLGEYAELPVATATTIYEGAMVGLTAGYARGLVAGDPFQGHAEKQVVNAGADGAKKVRVLRGIYSLEVTIASIAVTDVGSPVYASADGTLTLTAGANSLVGVVEQYVATNTCVVRFTTPEPAYAAIVVHEHTTGATGGPLTSPRVITGINDSNGNELIKVTATGSAVNEITLANGATGNGPSITSSGETNVPLTLAAKGTGKVLVGQATSGGVQLVASQPLLDENANELVKFVATADAVNELTVTNNATGSAPAISATGGDTDIDITLTPKGSGVVSVGGGISLVDVNIALGTTTGTKIGTAANQKIGFFNHAPVVQLAKASYNNWAAFGDVVNALVAIGLFDAA